MIRATDVADVKAKFYDLIHDYLEEYNDKRTEDMRQHLVVEDTVGAAHGGLADSIFNEGLCTFPWQEHYMIGIRDLMHICDGRLTEYQIEILDYLLEEVKIIDIKFPTLFRITKARPDWDGGGALRGFDQTARVVYDVEPRGDNLKSLAPEHLIFVLSALQVCYYAERDRNDDAQGQNTRATCLQCESLI